MKKFECDVCGKSYTRGDGDATVIIKEHGKITVERCNKYGSRIKNISTQKKKHVCARCLISVDDALEKD